MKNLSLGWLVMAAALAIGMTACSSADSIAEEPVQQPAENTDAVKKYTMTVTASKGGDDSALARAMAEAGLTGDATTRALTLGTDSETGKPTLSATWKAGETVKVYCNDKEIGTLTAQTDGAETTLSGTLDEAPTAGQDILLFYPKAPFDYTGQKGTLADIAQNFDYAEATIAADDWESDGDKITTTGTVNFTNQQAIVRFTIVDKADPTKRLKPSKLTISETVESGGGSTQKNYTLDGLTDATYTANAYAGDNGDGVLYAALKGMTGTNFTLTATMSDGDTYEYVRPAVEFEVGSFYSITVKMERETNRDLSAATTDIILRDGDMAYGTMPEGYCVMIPQGATVTLRDAHIYSDLYGIWFDYDGGDDDYATIILEGSNTVTGSSEAPGIFVPEDFTLTIKGSGSLRAESGTFDDGENKLGYAGIGGLPNGGNVIIEGGSITAKGGYGAPGIGGTYDAGGESSFGTITIKNTVTSVTATKGTDAPYCIGPSLSGSCGKITLGDDFSGDGDNIVYNGSEWYPGFYSPIEVGYNSGAGGMSVSPNETGDTWVLTPFNPQDQ